MCRRVTNEQVKNFYMNAKACPRVTTLYVETGFGQKRGGYICFAKVCKENGRMEIKSKNKKNVRQIEQQIQNYFYITNNLKSVDFEYLSRARICLLDVRKAKAIPCQKWHLYISLFAQEVAQNQSDWWKKKFKKYPCKQLKLWLAENAGVDVGEVEECIKNKKGKTAVHEAIDRIEWDEIYDKINAIEE